MPGFVRVVGPRDLVFPDYDGNGMFKSLGNILVNPAIGMLFIDLGGNPKHLRINGVAAVTGDDPLIETFVGATLGIDDRLLDSVI